LAGHEPDASVAVSGSDWPARSLVDRPCLRPATRQPADLLRQRTEDLNTQTISTAFQDLETDDTGHASENAARTTKNRWLKTVDDYFLHGFDDDVLAKSPVTETVDTVFMASGQK